MGKAILIALVFLSNDIGHTYFLFLLGLIKAKLVMQSYVLAALLNKFLLYFSEQVFPILHLSSHVGIVVLIKSYLLFHLDELCLGTLQL